MNQRRQENVGTGLIVVATAVSAVAVLVYQALGSRALGTDGFAPVAVMWTLLFLIYTILQLPAEQHLTRALVVTRDRAGIARVRRDMLAAFTAATVLGVAFTAFTLDRFFEGNPWFIAVAAGIMISRSLMAAGRGSLAGHRRFSAYAGTIAVEAGALLTGGIIAWTLDGSALVFSWVLVLAPLSTMVTRPFAEIQGEGARPDAEVQPGSFLAYLVAATAASQLIIAGGPVAVSFVGGTAAAVSIYFNTFALLRGPVTSSYNLVARVLPDFTELAHRAPDRLWMWPSRIALAGVGLAVVGALGSYLLLPKIVSTIYGSDFTPPSLAAALGGAGVGLGLAALFTTQVYSAAALGRRLAVGWGIGLVASVAVLVFGTFEPINRVALAFTVGEGIGLVMLAFVFPVRRTRSAV